MSLRSLFCFALAVCASSVLLAAKASPGDQSTRNNPGTAPGLELFLPLLNHRSLILSDSQPASSTSPSLFRETRETRLPYTSSLDLPQPLLLTDPRKLSALDEAYLDVFSILVSDHRCSRWYGGPAALEVLNELKRRVKLSHLDREIAFEMAGPYSIFTSASTHISYRMFSRNEVNLDGSFYRANKFCCEAKVFPVGMFLPSSREARMLVLLHELGHLIRQPEGDWLLPDDGRSALRSVQNTQQVLAQCNEEIRSVARVSLAQEWATLHRQVTSSESQTAVSQARDDPRP